MGKPTYLLDVNILVALADEDHSQHAQVHGWFGAPGLEFALCSLTEAAFIRLVMNSAVVTPPWTAQEAVEYLEALAKHPGYEFWPMADDWRSVVLPLIANIQGHNQIPDAYLLGLAIQRGGILATTDQRIGGLASGRFKQNLLLIP